MRAAKVDRNHAEIAQALRQVGCTVLSLAAVGRGCPDLAVSRRDLGNLFVEIKDGKQPPSKQRLTKAEQEFFDTWPGPAVVVRSVDEALAALVRIEAGRKR
jgi:hypothetical protein